MPAILDFIAFRNFAEMVGFSLNTRRILRILSPAAIAAALFFLVPAIWAVNPDDSQVARELDVEMSNLRRVAKQEGDACPCQRDSSPYATVMCRVEVLADQRKFSDAATVMEVEGAPLVADFKRDEFVKRLAILKKWSSAKQINLADYRHFYLGEDYDPLPTRAQPIVALWDNKRFPRVEKLVLLADFLENKGDARGEALALLMAADSEGAGQTVVARSLVRAGNAFYESGDRSRAEQSWIKASNFPHAGPDWPKAVYNLGVLEQRRRNFPRAIAYFEEVLASKPNDHEPGGNIMQAYRNYSHQSALKISVCYEAMGDYMRAMQYAKLAKNRYPYYSWCGTCLNSERMAVNTRILMLSSHQPPVRFAAIAILLALLPLL